VQNQTGFGFYSRHFLDINRRCFPELGYFTTLHNPFTIKKAFVIFWEYRFIYFDILKYISIRLIID